MSSSTSFVLLMVEIGAPVRCERICKLPRSCKGHYQARTCREALEGATPPSESVNGFCPPSKIILNSFKKMRLLPALSPKTSPAVTCLVTIPNKVLMSHKKDESFKVLTARCSLSTLGLFGYSEIILTLS